MVNTKINQKIVTIGGGSGSFMVLTGLKKYPVDLSAIVSMADDGGSSGILRREFGVLPPGDARQCLVALAEADKILKELFAYRYDNGGLKGHVFGNLFLSTLEKVSGGFDLAVKQAGSILKIKGRVLPVTLQSAQLVAELKNGKKIIGESKIYGQAVGLIDLKKLYLKPAAVLNAEAKEALKRADKIVICPGDLCSSLIANFLVKGLSQAIARAKAKVIYVSNLITKPGHTDGFTLADYIKTLEKYLGRGAIGYVVYNKERPAEKFLKKYLRPGENLVAAGDLSRLSKIKFLGYNLLSHQFYKATKGDVLGGFRSLVRHDSDKLAKVIYDL
ncbi:MAG: YvcK family protein [Parcubacteria group bacterium]|nr:YvcK family protein [Parcubacteria group bacterium]